MSRYQGKRFFSFLASVGLVGGGFMLGDPANFAVFAATIAALYGTYCAGQSFTDSRKPA